MKVHLKFLSRARVLHAVFFQVLALGASGAQVQDLTLLFEDLVLITSNNT
jgi:hypothetical protein